MNIKESQLENHLLQKLQTLKYTLRTDINNRQALEANFKAKFEALNKVNLSDNEFSRLLNNIVTADVFKAAQLLRGKNTLIRDDDTALNYTLVNIKDWCKNTFEVTHQLRMNTENSHHRYDVILLINGLPLVQIELKNYAISPRRAMKQIVDYKSDRGNGYTNTLMCFMQLFIVSNGHDTCYFSNNLDKHFNFNAEERFLPVYRWAAIDNKKITQIDDFAESFLEKCHLGQMIGRYMVLVQTEQKILMMRPYQIYAVKAIVDSIEQHRGNGYIWHTTGSGKTLTSFKASTLLKDNPNIDKCLFVVDRKDLDRQTREEFNKFQADCVEENTNTETLVQRLLSEDYADKIIVTTIQKLGLALNERTAKDQRNYKERLKPLQNKRIVFIFDECHRSQFGENHQAIKDFFPQSQLFGFTGTPIFEENATYTKVDGTNASYITTTDIFPNLLHQYTITHAIEDGNVLRFHVDYIEPKNEVNASPESIRKAIVEHILTHHHAITRQRQFNAILATASINEAIAYYQLFKQLQVDTPSEHRLNIACVFSPPAQGNKDVQQLQEDLEQEKRDNQTDPEDKKAALQEIITDYNAQYGTEHDIGKFDKYYQDVQKRIKDHRYSNQDYPQANKIDITIVVDMLLTGFDAKMLNTLYVDKNLKYHGLIQAFSRTNRVLNDTKPHGNIIDYRGQQQAVDDAISLFSGSHKEADKEIWLAEPKEEVIHQLQEAVTSLNELMQHHGLECKPSEVSNLKGDTARIEFINTYKPIQKLLTKLEQYADLTEADQQTIDNLISPTEQGGWKFQYLEIAKRFQEPNPPELDTDINPDELPEVELVLFASALIDYDYIIKLISQSTQSTKTEKMSREQLIDLILSDANLIDEREDWIAYIESLPSNQSMSEQKIKEGFTKFKAQKNTQALKNIATSFKLDFAELKAFFDHTTSRKVLDDDQLGELFHGQELGWKARGQKKLELVHTLAPILQKATDGKEISGLAVYLQDSKTHNH